MPRVFIKNLKEKIKQPTFGHISYAPNNPIRESKLPFEITLVDIDTKLEEKVQILSYVMIRNSLPEIFTLLSEKQRPEECQLEVLARNEVQTVNELAFYVYTKS